MKNTYHPIAIGEHEKKNKLKIIKSENNVNVQKQPPEVFFKKVFYVYVTATGLEPTTT